MRRSAICQSQTPSTCFWCAEHLEVITLEACRKAWSRAASHLTLQLCCALSAFWLQICHVCRPTLPSLVMHKQGVEVAVCAHFAAASACWQLLWKYMATATSRRVSSQRHCLSLEDPSWCSPTQEAPKERSWRRVLYF